MCLLVGVGVVVAIANELRGIVGVTTHNKVV